MSERSWEAFARQREKFARARESRDFRKRKPGLLERIRRFIADLFGK